MDKTVKEYALDTLRHPHVNRINFQYGPTRVYPSGFRDDVARAVAGDRIVFVADSGGHFTMDAAPGQQHRMAVPSDLVYADRNGTLRVKARLSPLENAGMRGTIVHEATHALQDFQRRALTPQISEGAAYLAGWIARLLWGYPRLSASATGREIEASAHSYARSLAAKLLDRQIVYLVPENDMRWLNAHVTTGAAHRYVFNGI